MPLDLEQPSPQNPTLTRSVAVECSREKFITENQKPGSIESGFSLLQTPLSVITKPIKQSFQPFLNRDSNA